MQGFRIKKIIFLYFLGLPLSQVVQSQSLTKKIVEADSLFMASKYAEAEIALEDIWQKNESLNPTSTLKLAKIKESRGQTVQALYLLNRFMQTNPSQALMKHIQEAAQKNGFEGYASNDFDYFLLLYNQYSPVAVGFLVLLAFYIFVIFITKKYKKEPIQNRQKSLFVAYLIGLLLFLNVPDNYTTGIVKNNNVLLRTEPSAAGNIAFRINEGHKVSVLRTTDIWANILWQKESVYIRKDQLYLVE